MNNNSEIGIHVLRAIERLTRGDNEDTNQLYRLLLRLKQNNESLNETKTMWGLDALSFTAATPPEYFCPFVIKILAMLISHGATNIQKAFETALQCRNLDAARFLYVQKDQKDHKPVDVNAVNGSGESLLYQAVTRGGPSVKVVRFLVEKEARVDTNPSPLEYLQGRLTWDPINRELFDILKPHSQLF